MSNSKFNGAMLLSGFATLVFSLFFVFGSFVLLQPLLQPNEPPLFLGAENWVIQAIGAAAALFGMFGLLIARGLAVLIAIEQSARDGFRGSNRSE
jgi:hypothetical protein